MDKYNTAHPQTDDLSKVGSSRLHIPSQYASPLKTATEYSTLSFNRFIVYPWNFHLGKSNENESLIVM